jgi:hypothetical protein
MEEGRRCPVSNTLCVLCPLHTRAPTTKTQPNSHRNHPPPFPLSSPSRFVISVLTLASVMQPPPAASATHRTSLANDNAATTCVGAHPSQPSFLSSPPLIAFVHSPLLRLPRSPSSFQTQLFKCFKHILQGHHFCQADSSHHVGSTG